MAGYDQLDWQAYEPQAVLARWKRQEIREGRLTAGEDVEDDEPVSYTHLTLPTKA